MSAEARNVVVIGASAGGIEALQRLLSGIAPGLQASVLIVVHTAPSNTRGMLTAVLASHSSLPVATAVDGQQLLPGLVTVAPADRHLIIDEGGKLRLWAGPRINRTRPAVDPLLVSAARHFGPRTTAVILSGTLDDGANGAAAVAAAGGTVLVQDPADAAYSEMPRAALALVNAATTAPATALGRLITEAVPRRVNGSTPRRRLHEEHRMTEHVLHGSKGVPSRLVLSCPDCGGGVSAVADGLALRYECHVGHSFAPHAMAAAQADSIEAALWTAAARLQEHAAVQQSIAKRMNNRSSWSTRRAEEAAAESLSAARIITEQLLPALLSARDAPAIASTDRSE
ncbi:chemotaxis protein CheB [Actinoplanes sp. NPDC024001]|uniref:chemotaxis protein CheB n=1 Tax=Actinoplanes sp. NPDC024001 TaxID=3154598 RepID=UPI0033D4FD0B